MRTVQPRPAAVNREPGGYQRGAVMRRASAASFSRGREKKNPCFAQSEIGGRKQAALGMLPAQQRLEAADPSGPQGDDGLVVQPELPSLERPPQVGLELEAGEGARMHLAVEHLEATAGRRPESAPRGRGSARRPPPPAAGRPRGPPACLRSARTVRACRRGRPLKVAWRVRRAAKGTPSADQRQRDGAARRGPRLRVVGGAHEHRAGDRRPDHLRHTALLMICALSPNAAMPVTRLPVVLPPESETELSRRT